MKVATKVLMVLGVALSLKSVVFLLLAAVGATPIPPALLAGMAAVWLAGSILALLLARHTAQRIVQKGGAARDSKSVANYGGSNAKEAPTLR
jgi:hypothetical protein